MNRITFWLMIFLLAYVVWKFVQIGQRKAARRQGPADRSDARPDSERAAGELPPTGRIRQSEPMLRCARCGVYLPASDAVEARGLTYCSPEHRDAPKAG